MLGFRFSWWFLAYFAVAICHAQDLAPRAYLITPTQANVITLTYAYNNGDVLFDPAIPIEGSKGQINTSIFTYYRSLDFFGRSANFTASLPYSVANFQALVLGREQQAYRSGLMDSVYRFSVNLKGGPAMPLKEFAGWNQKLLIGASIKIVAPTGQYDPARLINQGSNRWAFKPEVGLSRHWKRWYLDAYLGLWLFTSNHSFFPGNNVQSQRPMGSVEMHLSYDVKQRLWFSADGNYWYGGRSIVNGVLNLSSLQSNSRIGGTAAIPLTAHQSIKFSYSNGAYVIYGGDYQSVSMAWQYSWFGNKF